MATTELPVAMVISRNLPPLVGGMERLVWHIVDELRTEYRVHVIGPTGCGECLPHGVTVTEIPLKPMLLYLGGTILASMRQVLRLHPKFIFAGSGLTVPFAWLAARLTGARCVAYLHGLDIEVQHPAYRIAWLPFFRRCDRVLVNSRFTRKLAEQAGTPSQRISILHPGVKIPDIQSAAKQRVDFRTRYALGDSPLMLYVGRITARKGLTVFVRDILPSIIDQQPEARLIVIGDEPTQALHHQSGEKKRAQAILAENQLHNRVMFLQEIDDAQLQSAYFAADVLVFPTQEKSHDHEGFGMVAIEAAAHGLPTVAFAIGGVTDSISDGISGSLVSAGDNIAFAHAVTYHFNRRTDEISSACRTFAGAFSWENFGERLKFQMRRNR